MLHVKHFGTIPHDVLGNPSSVGAAAKTRRLPSFYLKLGFLFPLSERCPAGLDKPLPITVSVPIVPIAPEHPAHEAE
ncbi:MAG: hypothetical protein CR217_06595 [Beijerinckiaceae bacterium]|nr:MAG: hypothetical protein CR217_06595 [Beijerinckiaceae bacterium]